MAYPTTMNPASQELLEGPGCPHEIAVTRSFFVPAFGQRLPHPAGVRAE
jgi:hypothetical protein